MVTIKVEVTPGMLMDAFEECWLLAVRLQCIISFDARDGSGRKFDVYPVINSVTSIRQMDRSDLIGAIRGESRGVEVESWIRSATTRKWEKVIPPAEAVVCEAVDVHPPTS